MVLLIMHLSCRMGLVLRSILSQFWLGKTELSFLRATQEKELSRRAELLPVGVFSQQDEAFAFCCNNAH